MSNSNKAHQWISGIFKTEMIYRWDISYMVFVTLLKLKCYVKFRSELGQPIIVYETSQIENNSSASSSDVVLNDWVSLKAFWCYLLLLVEVQRTWIVLPHLLVLFFLHSFLCWKKMKGLVWAEMEGSVTSKRHAMRRCTTHPSACHSLHFTPIFQ